ncbi:molybdopterin-dependent oxidoreductase [Cellulomonas soli]|uniref:molybdopterin-dependent oxidoreductase n=1 Tax=Cellulomonas soli TaxID=931535 RepID=UPI003F8473B1
MPSLGGTGTGSAGGGGRRGRWAWVLAGLAGWVAAAVTLGVSHLLAGLVDPGSSPWGVVGDAFIDVTPGWLKDAAIAVFGVHDKTALLVGMVLVLAVLAAGIGVLAARNVAAGIGAVLLLGAVGAAVAWSRPGAAPAAGVASVVGAVVGAVALVTLTRALQAAQVEAVARSARAVRRAALTGATPVVVDPDRRRFLGLVAGWSVVAVVGAAVGAVAGGARAGVAAARAALRLPRAVRPAAAVPAGAQAPVQGVVDVVTANGDFYRIDTAFTVPQVDPATWSLRVHGLVEQEVVVPFEELLGGDLVEAYVTLACVSNPVGGDLVGNARWLGLPVREVLARARPVAGADMVLSRSADGFTASTPLPVLLDGRDALLAVGMNGEPLPTEHGFPVRMVVPGLYGYVSATKWLVELEVSRFADQQAYWTRRGWSERGPVKTSSRIEVPRAGARVAAGPVDVGGTAWAQHTGITGVQVRVDEGPWSPAVLAEEISVDTWRQWSWRWDAVPGTHVLQVRASDPVAGTQTGEPADVVPDGATGWHQVTVIVEG